MTCTLEMLDFTWAVGEKNQISMSISEDGLLFLLWCDRLWEKKSETERSESLYRFRKILLSVSHLSGDGTILVRLIFLQIC